ncbi:MAG: sulfatase [Bacteroidales bacterium]|nr:sulfatase [Bacteroidales bacterium]
MELHKYIVPALAMLPCVQSMQARQPNFVIINLDDSGYGDFSCNGARGYRTPAIDSLAANGLRFTNFLAAQPVSGASRAGLLTGCYPNRIGLSGAPGHHDVRGIAAEEVTLAEMLHDAGYRSAIFGKWHLGDAMQYLPLQNGFDEFYGLPYSNDMWPNHPQKRYPDLPTIEGNTIIGYNTDQSRFTTDYTTHAVDFMQRNADRPFLLYVAHSMPHVPLAVSDKFKGKSDIGLYGDVMMELDWSVGQIAAAVDSLGLSDDTYIIVMSDNGPWLRYGNHAGSTAGLREAKQATFEGGSRVPCIVYSPRNVRSGVCNRLVSNIDIYPTLAELAGAKLPEHDIDGVSITSLLADPSASSPRKFFTYYYRKNDLEAVSDGRYKLIFPHTYNSNEGCRQGRDGMPGDIREGRVEAIELYDLRTDPGERYNIAGTLPEIESTLMAEADHMRGVLGDDLTGAAGTGRRLHAVKKENLTYPEEKL